MLFELGNKQACRPQNHPLHYESKYQKIMGELDILVSKFYYPRMLSMLTRLFTYLENQLPVYDEADRVKWDLFISILILIAAFEIPYDWLVGWQDQTWAHVFNLIFFISFFIDMVLNSLTQRREEPWFFTQMLIGSESPIRKSKIECYSSREKHP